MKKLNSAPKFMAYAVSQAVRHPRTPIKYYYCPNCKAHFASLEGECPTCNHQVNEEQASPELREQSPVPWWGAVLVIIIGVSCWCIAATNSIGGLDEAARALVYVPLGNMFGLSLRR